MLNIQQGMVKEDRADRRLVGNTSDVKEERLGL